MRARVNRGPLSPLAGARCALRLVAVSLTGCSPQIEGQVVDGVSELPIANVRVQARGETERVAITRADGLFQIRVSSQEALVPLTFQKAGYYSRTISFLADGPSKSLIRLESIPDIVGSVVNGLTQESMAGCAVRVNGESRSITDERGFFRVKDHGKSVPRVDITCGNQTQRAALLREQPNAFEYEVRIFARPPARSRLWLKQEGRLEGLDRPLTLPRSLLVYIKRSPGKLFQVEQHVRKARIHRPLVEAIKPATVDRSSELFYLPRRSERLVAVPLLRLEARRYPPLYADGSGPQETIQGGYFLGIRKIEEYQQSNYGVLERGRMVHFGSRPLVGRNVPGGKGLKKTTLNLDPGLWCLTWLRGSSIAGGKTCWLVRSK